MNYQEVRDRIAEDLAERDRNAVWTVAAHAVDRDDCAELLAMLGLDASTSRRCPRSAQILPSVPSSPESAARAGTLDSWHGYAR